MSIVTETEAVATTGPLGGFVAFVYDHWQIFAGGLMVLAFGIVILGKNHDINYYKGEVAAQQSRINAMAAAGAVNRANNATLSQAVQTQNNAVNNLAAIAAAREKSFDAVMEQITQSRVATQTSVAKILAAQAPADKCQGALDLVRSNVQ